MLAHQAASALSVTGGKHLELLVQRAAQSVLGADFVVNTIQVGGARATQADFDVPARFGLRYTIADTVGVGGVFRGLRTIPVVLGIARDMEEICPDA